MDGEEPAVEVVQIVDIEEAEIRIFEMRKRTLLDGRRFLLMMLVDRLGRHH